MKKIDEAKNESHKSNGNKADNGKRIPIIDTLKPKKRYTKQEKELMKAFKEAMDAIGRQQNAKV